MGVLDLPIQDQAQQTGFLPVLVIDTSGLQPIVSEDIYLTCTATVSGLGKTPPVGYANAQIKGHGNSTWGQTKNPYKLKLASKQPLFGMASAKNWILLANYFDQTPVNTAVAFTVGYWMTGLAFTPHFRFVEVVLNGNYIGMYQVTEDKELNSARVNQPTVSGDTGLGLTGTYLFEVDFRWPSSSDPGFETSRGTPYSIDDPSAPDSTQLAYLQSWVQTFEDALYSGSFVDPVNGYAKYIDMNSWADWYIVNELFSSTDSDWGASCIMYKTRDTTVPGKLFMGPLWDFDLTFGNPSTNIYTAANPQGITYPNYIIRLFQDPAFITLVATRWNALYAAHLVNGDIYAVIDNFITQLDSAVSRDNTKYRLTEYYSPQWAYNRKIWLQTRIGFLNTYFNRSPDPVTSTVLATV